MEKVSKLVEIDGTLGLLLLDPDVNVQETKTNATPINISPSNLLHNYPFPSNVTGRRF